MPYADPAKQRAAKRESAARRRAAARIPTDTSAPIAGAERVEAPPMIAEPEIVMPAVEPLREPEQEAVSGSDLFVVGKVLGIGLGLGETPDAYRERLRERWGLILKVIG